MSPIRSNKLSIRGLFSTSLVAVSKDEGFHSRMDKNCTGFETDLLFFKNTFSINHAVSLNILIT